jgi:exopolysaccharide production protein ExoQ
MEQRTEALELATKEPIYTLVNSWILLFPLLVFASGYGFSFERGALNTNAGATFAAQGISGMGLEKSPVLRIQAILVYLICASLMLPFVRIIVANFRHDILISGLTLLAVVSCIWSQNSLKTLEYAILLIAGMAFSFYLLERFPANELMKLFVMVGAVAAIGSLFLIVFFPQYGLQNRAAIVSGAWEGIFGHKNNCGEIMTYLLMPAFFVRLKSRPALIFRVAYIVIVLLIIAMSRSAGAWVVCGSCMIFIATIHLLVRMPRRDLAALALMISGIVAIAGIVVYKYFDMLMFAIGKDPTMTGRTVLWSGLMPSLMRRPLLGYGFMAFWQGLHGESASVGLLMRWPGIGYAENGVIELWLELGAVGVALYLFAFFRAVKDAVYCFTREPSPGVMSYIALLFALAISNIEGGILLSPTDLKFLLPMIAFLGLRREAQRVRTRGMCESSSR